MQFNGQDTNGQAGSVQGYNGLPGLPPLDRSELYQVWFRQKLFDMLVVRVGRTVPTYDFNNVTRPAPTQDQELKIPAVSGLLYTPIFVNPTMLGAMPGYYNSADGVTLTLTPTRHTYLNYGFYDGNLANGVQTGLVGPQFNGYYFHIWEAGFDWVLGENYPGQFGAGMWYQTGQLNGPGDISENGTGGFYLFGGQRVWGREAAQPVVSDKGGKSKISPAGEQDASVSVFYQFGVNNSETLPVNQYFGDGLRTHPPPAVGLGWLWHGVVVAESEFVRPFERVDVPGILSGAHLWRCIFPAHVFLHSDARRVLIARRSVGNDPALHAALLRAAAISPGQRVKERHRPECALAIHFSGMEVMLEGEWTPYSTTFAVSSRPASCKSQQVACDFCGSAPTRTYSSTFVRLLESCYRATRFRIPHQKMVGATGFEPATSWSQTTRSTKLSYAPSC